MQIDNLKIFLKIIYPALILDALLNEVSRLIFDYFTIAKDGFAHTLLLYLLFPSIIFIGYLASKTTDHYMWNSIKGGAFLVFIWTPFFIVIQSILLFGTFTFKVLILGILGMLLSQLFFYPFTFVCSLIGGYIASKVDENAQRGEMHNES
ncbi:MAG: hypothetical protein ACAH07_00850 [Methylophilaceae bacterium]|nr:hypothetical protein [Methyloradius sp.]